MVQPIRIALTDKPTGGPRGDTSGRRPDGVGLMGVPFGGPLLRRSVALASPAVVSGAKLGAIHRSPEPSQVLLHSVLQGEGS